MSEIQHTNRAHARLNASSSHRWMMCPPSVKLSEQFEDKPSTYAEEGSFLHELCELKLHRYLGDMAMEAVEAQYAEHRDSEFYSDEAESVTDEYVAFCIETIEAVRSSCPDPLIMVEHRLDYSEYVPEGFGTGDLVIVADGVIEVIDFNHSFYHSIGWKNIVPGIVCPYIFVIIYRFIFIISQTDTCRGICNMATRITLYI